MAYEDKILGFRVRINSIIVYQKKICKPRLPGSERSKSPFTYVAYKAMQGFGYNKLALYEPKLITEGESDLKNRTLYLGDSGSTDAFSILFNSFDRNDSNGSYHSKVGKLMHLPPNLYSMQLKKFGNVSLKFGSLYFGNYLNIIDGYVISQPFFRNCHTHPQYCAASHHLLSFWFRLESGKVNGTHLWIGNGNFTFVKVSNQDKNIHFRINSNKVTCTANIPIALNKWTLIQIQAVLTDRGEKIMANESKIVIHGVDKSLSCIEQNDTSIIDEENGYIVLGGDYSTGSITDKGRSNIDDLYVYFDGRKDKVKYGTPLKVYGHFQFVLM